MNLRGPAARVIGWILLAVILWFVGVALVDAGRSLDWSQVRPAPLPIAMGVLLFAASVALADFLVRLLYRNLGVSLPPTSGLVLYFVPMLGRYVPGKVVAIAGHIVLARRYGVELRIAAAAVGLLTVLGLTAAVAVGLVFLLIQPPEVVDTETIRWFLAAGFGVIAVAFLPGIWLGLINAVFRMFGREPLEVRPDYPAMLRLLAGMSAHAALTVAGYAAITGGSIGLTLEAMPLLMGSICIANTIGFLAVFAPGGIGVREGILLVLLGPTLGAGPAALFTIALRLAQIAVDTLAAGIGYWFLKTNPSN